MKKKNTCHVESSASKFLNRKKVNVEYAHINMNNYVQVNKVLNFNLCNRMNLCR